METKTENKEVANPFQRQLHDAASVGAVEIESSRAIAEAQGKLVIAKRFPRDEAEAFAKVMQSCQRLALAEAALYSFPRGGQTISGPSIRFAEELARCWGNLDFGIRELSQKENESEMEAYCWDLQTNVISSQKFTVKHERHTQQGVKKLTDPRDKYEMTANQGSRRLRSRILAILPPDLIETALLTINETLAGGKPKEVGERVAKMLEKFKEFDVTKKHIETFLGKVVDKITGQDVANLIGIYTTIKDGIKDASDYFGPKDAETKAINQVNADASTPKKKKAKKKEEEKEPETGEPEKPAEEKTTPPAKLKAEKNKAPDTSAAEIKVAENTDDDADEPEDDDIL